MSQNIRIEISVIVRVWKDDDKNAALTGKAEGRRTLSHASPQRVSEAIESIMSDLGDMLPSKIEGNLTA